MSSLTLDYTNCLSEAIGATHGLIKSEVDTLAAKFPKHHENIDELRANGESSFFDLPYQDTSELKALLKKHQGRWDNLVVVAIGGSSLAPKSLLTALGHGAFNQLEGKARKGAPRVFFASNSDPRQLTDLFEVLDLKKTLFQITSKSGTSVETMAMAMWLLDLLKRKVGKAAVSAQVVITTDRDKSPLMEIAKQEKIDTLHVPTNLAGRYGVLGNSGLFTAGLCGISIDALLKGAADMDKRCRHGDAFKNPAYMHALVHYLLTRKRRKTMHVTFSFSNRLHGIGEWYSHLCSVSLGKMLNRKGKAVHVGPSPVAALGTFDQHGQMQLFCEGPFDKVMTFVTVKDHGAKVVVPASYPKLEPVAHLHNADFTTIMDYGYWGAEQHVTASGRPNMTIQLDQVDEANVGGLYYLFQLSTTMSAELYGIDPFDQPGVEHSKHATFAQFGRPGFEDLAKRIKEYRTKPRRTC
jgi:glucose-6-phosphate isomerase